jgi:Flp pilus assembly protein TadG
MTGPIPFSTMGRLRVRLAQFRQDGRGFGAAEFAMILPLMLLLLFGTIEIANGVAVDRKVTLLTRTLSDLTSRATSVYPVDVSNFFMIGGAIMQPYPDTQLKATISEVYIDPVTSVGRVQWSEGTAKRALKSPVTVPDGLISKDSTGKAMPNQYLIYSEVSYLYVPVVGYVMAKAGITLSDQTFTRPRQSACVFFDPPPSTPNPSCPTS